jgi:hypothetical protein
MRHEIESGYHPDADQISAFVEHALPAHEQQQMLAHLAVCPECRGTVGMALPSQNEAATPAEQPWQIRWLTGWRLALPATALAAITTLLVVLLHNSSRQQQAVNPRVQVAVSKSPAIVPPTSRAETRAPQPKRVEPPATSDKTALKPRQLVAGRNLMRQEQLQSFTSTNEATVQSVPPTAAASPAASPSTGQASVPLVQQSSAVAPPAEIFDAKSTPQVESVGGPIDGLMLKETPQSSVLSPLPGGHPILSLATHFRQVLAIDTRNHIFLSVDGGATWRAVPARWKGRAVQASLVSYGSPAAGSVLKGLSLQRPAEKKRDYIARDNPIPLPAQKPSTNASAQASGIGLTGTVSDETGAAIPGATITATSTTGQPAGTATSDAIGHFMLSNLSPGSYDLTTRASGFQQQLTQGVNVSSAQPNVANVTLSVGSSAQTVEVQGETPQLETVQPPALAAESIGSLQAAALPIFEIVTDKGEHWTSPDGMNWTRK